MIQLRNQIIYIRVFILGFTSSKTTAVHVPGHHHHSSNAAKNRYDELLVSSHLTHVRLHAFCLWHPRTLARVKRTPTCNRQHSIANSQYVYCLFMQPFIHHLNSRLLLLWSYRRSQNKVLDWSGKNVLFGLDYSLSSPINQCKYFVFYWSHNDVVFSVPPAPDWSHPRLYLVLMFHTEIWCGSLTRTCVNISRRLSGISTQQSASYVRVSI